MEYEPTDGKWCLSNKATTLRELQSDYPPGWLEKQIASLKLMLCEYFSVGDCDHKLGKTISPVGLTKDGGKILKVRWQLPGQGKRGGLRLCMVVYCKERRVVVAEGWPRKENVQSEEFKDAANNA